MHTTNDTTPTPRLSRWEWGALVVILLVAAFLRFYRLNAVPPGLTHDEADFVYDAVTVYNGARPLYIAKVGYQAEPFMHYASALVMTLAGPNHLAVRLTSALFGMLLIGLVFVWTRMTFGPPVALATAAFMTVGYWAVATSRFAIRAEPTASLATLAAIFFWLGMELPGAPIAPKKWWNAVWWIGFTLVIAASIYVYEAPRVTWAVYPAFAALLAVTQPRLLRRHGWKLALALVVAGLLALPLLTHPMAWNRVGHLTGPLEAARSGSFGPLLKNVLAVLGMFNVRGDPFITYNISGRPVFDLLTGALFVIGVALCLWRWRQPAAGFSVVWLLIGAAPAMLSELHSATLRAIVAQPAAYIFPGVALSEAVNWIIRRRPTWARALLPVTLAVALVGGGALTYHEYFVRWGQSPEVRGTYFNDLYQALTYIDTHPVDRPTVISVAFPTLPHDPYVAWVMPHQNPPDLRWVDGRRALVLPSGSAARLVTLSRAPLAPPFAQALAGAQTAHVPLEGTGNAFDIYDWNPAATLDALYPAHTTTTADGLSLPVNFGGAAELLGYTVEPEPIAAGQTLTVTTAWRVIDPAPLGPVSPEYYGYDAAIFVQLLDANRQVVAQEDRLDAPAWDWRPGEVFIQAHVLTLGADLAAGQYDLALGLYARPAIRRLPVQVEGVVQSDATILATVGVERP
ncbi:MAG: hypothetical protein WHX52_02595 [Anaerolineae bacterium]